jgi:hypothetical protein
MVQFTACGFELLVDRREDKEKEVNGKVTSWATGGPWSGGWGRWSTVELCQTSDPDPAAGGGGGHKAACPQKGKGKLLCSYSQSPPYRTQLLAAAHSRSAHFGPVALPHCPLST